MTPTFLNFGIFIYQNINILQHNFILYYDTQHNFILYYGTHIEIINFIPRVHIMEEKFEYPSVAFAIELFLLIPSLNLNIPIDFSVKRGGNDTRVIFLHFFG